MLMDYAPDYRYYVSDIGRVWPVNGKYTAGSASYCSSSSTTTRRSVTNPPRRDATADPGGSEGRNGSGLCANDVLKTDLRTAARRLVEKGGGVFSHTVGMAVHDVGSYRDGLKPGQVFSVDPQLRVPEENLYLRYEDTVAVTETGVENFTDFLPMELEAIEKLVQEKGIVQKVPALVTLGTER